GPVVPIVPPNTPPSFIAPTPFAPISVQAGSPVNFAVWASDPDAGGAVDVTVDVASLPLGAGSGTNGHMNPAYRDFTWTPGAAAVGPHTINFTATLIPYTTLFRSGPVVPIVPPNTPPSFIAPTPFAPISVQAGSPVSFAVWASDP